MLQTAVVSSHHAQRIVSILDEAQENIHESLHRDSVRLISYTLLVSCDMDAQDRGLRFLLVGCSGLNAFRMVS